MPKVVVIGPNLPTAGCPIHVHAEGCADINRSPLYKSREFDSDKKNVVDLASLKSIVHYNYPPGDFDYDGDTKWRDFAGDIKVFPCVKDLADE